MEIYQKLLIVVVIVLTSLVLILGIQAFLILKDVRRSVKKINAIIDDSMFGGGLIKKEKILNVLQMFKKNKGFDKREPDNF
jgi:hypothetical protein